MSNGEITEDRIRLVALPSYPIVELKETSTSWVLGAISLSKTYPGFSYGFGGTLNHDSRFRKQPFTFATGTPAIALIFRRCDVGAKTGLPEEWFCGWVPVDREREAERWVRFLNQELRWRLVEKRERDEQATGASDKPSGDSKDK